MPLIPGILILKHPVRRNQQTILEQDLRGLRGRRQAEVRGREKPSCSIPAPARHLPAQPPNTLACDRLRECKLIGTTFMTVEF